MAKDYIRNLRNMENRNNNQTTTINPYEEADRLRKELEEDGYKVMTTKDGTVVVKKIDV